MSLILYTGLQAHTLELLIKHIALPDIVFEQVPEAEFKVACKKLLQYDALLLGEETDNPIRLAQEAYAQDKSISVLLLNEGHSHAKIKQTLQFSPFIGPTIQSFSNEIGQRLAPIVEDAMQRTKQRRSFANMKSTTLSGQAFAPNTMEQVRTDFTTKVLEEAPIGAVLVSGSGMLFSINNYALNLFGKTEKEVLGTPFPGLFPASLQAEVRNYLLDSYQDKRKRVIEIRNAESLQYLELSVAPVGMRTSGNYKLIILNDITSEVMARQHTQAHLEQLEKLNANLARVNADLDTFVYTASHDLKSPILNIEGLVTSLETELGPAQEQVRQELDHIKRSILRFKQTVEDLTEVSRIQRSIEEEASELQVAELLEDIGQLLEREITDAGAEIILNTTAPALFFPKRNLTSMLLNLISNAIKYRSPLRKLQIVVKTWREGPDYCISVQDNGLGIPADKQERVFQLFKRMHSHVAGSGVGLYIVKRMIDSNGGQVTVKSEEGNGAIFTLRLKEYTQVAPAGLVQPSSI